MSTAYLLLLLLLSFLCISLHPCYARHLSPLNKKLEDKSFFSVKSYEKNELDDSSPKQLNEGHDKTESGLVVDSEKHRNRRSMTDDSVQHKAIEKASGALEKSVVSVSWRQKHVPAFDVDYAPLKPHPPQHNGPRDIYSVE